MVQVLASPILTYEEDQLYDEWKGFHITQPGSLLDWESKPKHAQSKDVILSNFRYATYWKINIVLRRYPLTSVRPFEYTEDEGDIDPNDQNSILEHTWIKW